MQRRRLGRRLHAALAVTALFAGVATAAAGPGVVLHVDADAPANGDGTTWSRAFRHLQDAVAVAALGGVTEVRVAEGTYRPDRDAEHPDGTGDRNATFAMIGGVALRGGYAGFGAADPDARDIDEYETVLSGDLLGDDGPDFTNADDNSEHVVTAENVDRSGVLDGFTVIAGHATLFGGGLLIEGGGPTLVRCTFRANYAGFAGGGVDSLGATASVVECRFTGNRGEFRGGGMRAHAASSPDLTGCTFVANEAGDGGGLSIRGGTVVDCAFEDNIARNAAGGLDTGDSVLVRGCDFRGNRAGTDGGGLMDLGGMTLLACTFEGNEAGYRGGGLVDLGTGSSIDACVFQDNLARWGGGMAIEIGARGEATITGTTLVRNRALADGGGALLDRDSTVVMDDCTFDGNTAGAYGGGLLARIDVDLAVTTCRFRRNATDWRGGGVAARAGCRVDLFDSIFEDNEAVEGGGAYIESSDLAATRCAFRGNRANEGGAVSTPGTDAAITRSAFHANAARRSGGAIADYGRLRELSSCVFTGNTAAAFGGAIDLSWAGPVIVNCVFSGNAAGNSGGAIRSSSGLPVVVNSAFAANTAPFGGAVSNASGAVILANSVLWHNGDEPLEDADMLTVLYSVVEGGADGPGNLDADPLFVDADGADGVPGTPDDDLRLRPGSPCIDAGDNTAVPVGVTVDLDGAARFRDDPDTPDTGAGTPPVVDMGPYEFAACRADLDGSGAVDFGDIVAVLAAWGPCAGCAEDLDGSGVVDFGDILPLLADWGECP